MSKRNNQEAPDMREYQRQFSHHVLSVQDYQRVVKGIREMAFIGCAIESVGRVAEIITIISGCAPSDSFSDLHAEMANPNIMAGLNTAMKTLGCDIAEMAERMESIMDDADYLAPEKPQ